MRFIYKDILKRMILKRNLRIMDLIYPCSLYLSNKRYAVIINEQRKSIDD